MITARQIQAIAWLGAPPAKRVHLHRPRHATLRALAARGLAVGVGGPLLHTATLTTEGERVHAFLLSVAKMHPGVRKYVLSSFTPQD